ncbi:unnamed protein product, partial [Brassica napus]
GCFRSIPPSFLTAPCLYRVLLASHLSIKRCLLCLRVLALCLNVFGSDCHQSFIYASSRLLFFGSRRQRMASVLGGSRWSTASRYLSVTPFVGCGISQYQLWSLDLVGSVPLCP